MEALPHEVTPSSLPHLRSDGNQEVEIYLACEDAALLPQSRTQFLDMLSQKRISATLLDV